MSYGALCGAKVAIRCVDGDPCVEPRWQVDVVWSIVWIQAASRCCMEHCVEPRWQVDIVWSIAWSQGCK